MPAPISSALWAPGVRGRTSITPADATSLRALAPRPALDMTLDRGQELGGQDAVQGAVVPGEAEDRHRADRDRVVAAAVGDHDRPLDDRLEVEDRHLRLVDD